MKVIYILTAVVVQSSLPHFTDACPFKNFLEETFALLYSPLRQLTEALQLHGGHNDQGIRFRSLVPQASESAAAVQGDPLRSNSNPTLALLAKPSPTPKAGPTARPTASPISNPSARPSASPIASPTPEPTAAPSFRPSSLPTASPTTSPTLNPLSAPTLSPSSTPAPSRARRAPSAFPTTNTEANPSPPSSNPSTVAPSPSPLNPTESPTVLPTVDTSVGLPAATCKAGPTSPITNSEMCSLTASISADFSALILNYSPLQRSLIFGPALRLAFHDAGEINLSLPGDSLGPDGCLSPSSENNGLIEGASVVNTVIEQMWQKYCTKISRADFWAYLGKLAAETAAQPEVISAEYYFGRRDSQECSAGAGRLPEALATQLGDSQGYFSASMGLSLEDTVTLLGAHSLGHMSPTNSGFGRNPTTGLLDSNAWDSTPDKLDNLYYLQLIGIPWIFQGASAAPTFHLQDFVANGNERVLTNVDMSLAFDIDPARTGVPSVARCGGGGNQCSRVSSTLSLIAAYTDAATGNKAFVDAFAKSYTKMVNAGYGYDGSIGKLGNLTALQC